MPYLGLNLTFEANETFLGVTPDKMEYEELCTCACVWNKHNLNITELKFGRASPEVQIQELPIAFKLLSLKSKHEFKTYFYTIIFFSLSFSKLTFLLPDTLVCCMLKGKK